MTGAGSVDYAFVKESSFKNLPGSPSYYEPGRDPDVTELTLERALERQRQPNSVWSTQSVAGNLEGAFAIEWTIDDSRQGDVHDILFNSSGPYTLSSGLAATSRWYIGLDWLNGTTERELIGCAPVDYTVTYTQGGQFRAAATFIYADEQYNGSITPSNINEATGNSAQWHGLDLSIDGTTQSKEQSVELSITDMSRFQRGSDAVAIDAVVGPANAQLTTETVYTEDDQLELAYGGSGQSSTSKTMSEVSGTLDVKAANSTIASHTLSGLKPDSHGWNEVFNGDDDVTENVVWNLNGDPAVSVS